jgi:hypothetical protein
VRSLAAQPVLAYLLCLVAHTNPNLAAPGQSGTDLHLREVGRLRS